MVLFVSEPTRPGRGAGGGLPATDLVLRSASYAAILGCGGDLAINGTGQCFFQRVHAMVGRELRMVELKQEVNDVCDLAGVAGRYALEFEKERP